MFLVTITRYWAGLPFWLQDSLLILFAVAAGSLVRFLLFKLLKSFFRKHQGYPLLKIILKRTQSVVSYLLPIIVLLAILPAIHVLPEAIFYVERLLRALLIIGFAWLAIQAVLIIQDIVNQQFNIENDNNLRARKIRTQVQFIKRLAIISIVIVAISILLLSFESVRNIGAGLLTSAGVTGIILGFAAQKSIANLIAGFQIAFTQPIRIDDVVIVQDEFARVEEITLTYVVLRIWDQRRLILPINYFIENSFQNWTRNTADIMATVYFYTDYHVPMEALRKELREICEKSPYWDKRVCGLSMTDATTSAVQLRALVSATNANNAWELKITVREKIIEFLQAQYPDCLPRYRTEVKGGQFALK